MIAQASPAAGPLQTDPSKRVNYTLGLVLGVDEFQQDQLYHAAGRRGHNRLLHGYGTVWGLHVGPVTQGADPEVQVDPGVAVDPAGREIRVPDRMCVKLDKWLDRHRATLAALYPDPAAQTIPVAVVLCHRECPADTVPVPGEPCRSQDDAMQPSRIRESFELKLMLRDDAPWAAPLQGNDSGLGIFRLHQPEEQAVRAFGQLLARVQTTTDPLLSAHGRDDLLWGVRQLAHSAEEETLSSPPAPNDDPILLPAATAPEILREAFRVWVTEVRPALRGMEDPGGCDADECCVLLAEFDLPVTGSWAVKAGAIDPVEERRPYLLHTRLLQEWLIAGGGEDGRPDVDSFATLQILGPKRIRAWVHHEATLDVPRSAVTLVLNDQVLDASRIEGVPWASLRNVYDVTLTAEMADGDVVELRFDTTQMRIVQPAPDPVGSWTPAAAESAQPPRTVADELKGPSGEYLDRYGWQLSAFTVYDRLEGGDLRGEYKLPIVAKIQGTPVSETAPTRPDHYLRYDGSQWKPQLLDTGTQDLRERYPESVVTGIQKHPVAETTPKDKQYLVSNGTQWSPQFLEEGTQDLRLRYPGSVVTGIQKHPVAETAPKKNEYLVSNGSEWAPRPLPGAEGDLSGTYPALRIEKLQGKTVTATDPQVNEVLTYNGRAWVPAPVAFDPESSDLAGDAPKTIIAKLQGKPVDTRAGLSAGRVLSYDGSRWVPNGVATLLGAAGGDLEGSYPEPQVTGLRSTAIASTTPTDGQVLAYRAAQGIKVAHWAPVTVATLLGSAKGDLEGSYPAPTVAGLRGTPIAGGVEPEEGQMLALRAVRGERGVAWVPGMPSGDLAGAYPGPEVAGLRGRPIAGTAPEEGQVLVFRSESGEWTPELPEGGASSGDAGGDLAGTYPAPTVAGLRGRPIADAEPGDGEVLVFRAENNAWIPESPERGGATGDAGGDLGGSYPEPRIARLQDVPVEAKEPREGDCLVFNGSAWVPSPMQGGAAADYQVVAAGVFHLDPTSGSERPGAYPLANPYGGLSLSWLDGGMWMLDFKSYDPGKFVYVIKGLSSMGVVGLLENYWDRPVISVPSPQDKESQTLLHLEVSAYRLLETFDRRPIVRGANTLRATATDATGATTGDTADGSAATLALPADEAPASETPVKPSPRAPRKRQPEKP